MSSLSKIISITTVFIGMLIIAGCSDLLEKDIENKIVYVNAPPDSLRTTIVTQTFWWNFIEGADYYNLQIVSPRFDYIERMVLDTTVTNNKFQFTLVPGVYEWRVSAFNSGYATPYTVSTLFVDSTHDLSFQQVVLKRPAPNMATNITRLDFSWEKIYSANLYNFEVRQGNWNGEVVAGPVETVADTVSLVLAEGIYAWGVKALNDISGSQFSTRSFMVDLTPPGKPELTAPASGQTYKALPIQLTWERPDAGGSAITDSINIATDSVNFSRNIKETHKTTNTYYNISFSNAGDYYWRIRSIDAAGNKSTWSSIRKFTIEAQ
jgi:predicted phage tail protein